MRNLVQLRLVGLLAGLLLAIGVTTASAGRIESSTQNVRLVWSSLEFASTLVTVRCKLTLEGSFHSRTIQKVERTLIGAVTRAIMQAASCTNGKGWTENGVEVAPLGTLANTLPWHITYESFNGTLPAITAVNLLVSRFRLVAEVRGAFGETCIGRYGTATDNITGKANREAGGVITSLTPVEGRNTLNLVNQLGTDPICPASGRFRTPATDGRVTVLGSANTIVISLI